MLSEALKNLPWAVMGCGNSEHDASWSCHKVRDAAGNTLLHSVTREVAEAFAGIPALMADNAALVKAMKDARDAWVGTDDVASIFFALGAVGEMPHPGSALLEEVRTLRERVEALELDIRDVNHALTFDAGMPTTGIGSEGNRVRVLAAEAKVLRERVAALEMEHEEDQGVISVWRGRTGRAEEALADARNAALEEAARRVDVEAQESHTREAASLLDDVAKRIRAIKTKRDSANE